MARGEYAAAISAFQQSDLKSALVWNGIGMAYHHLYALEEARKAYQQALTMIRASPRLPIISLPCITASMILRMPSIGTSER